MAVQGHSADETLCIFDTEIALTASPRVHEVSAQPLVPSCDHSGLFQMLFLWTWVYNTAPQSKHFHLSSALGWVFEKGLWCGGCPPVALSWLRDELYSCLQVWEQCPVPFPFLLQELQGSTDVAESLIISCGSS